MLLLDLSGIAYHKVINFYADDQTPPIEDVRYVLLNEIREYEELYGKVFGRVVICADCKPYWRTQIQPAYKMNRLKARATSTINSEQFYKDLAIIKQDIIEHTAWILLETDGAEADDLIAVLTEQAKEPVTIISSDKDMIQLQVRHEEVYQFSPNRNHLLTLGNTEYDMLTHILKGDTSDGIPNVFSTDDHFMLEERPRQKSVSKKIIAEVREYYPDNISECELLDKAAQARYVQNKVLIDTTFTPKKLQDTIIRIHAEATPGEDNLEALLSPFNVEEEL